jgi:hypothetical protein
LWDPVPDTTVRTFKNDGQFHLLGVPYEKSLQSVYYPASIPADTYPGMVPSGQKLETISLNAIVAAYNWPQGSDRYQRVAHFAETFLSKFGDLQKQGRDPIWQSIDPVGVAQVGNVCRQPSNGSIRILPMPLPPPVPIRPWPSFKLS